MNILKDILYNVALVSVQGSTDVHVNAVHYDSRKINKNDVFVAIKGAQFDGHSFINSAIENGASVIVAETLPQTKSNNITYIEVESSSSALAYMSANFYQHPSKNLKLIGITGTNGKTTVATLLFNLFKAAGYKVGLISTVKIVVDKTTYTATHTTPDSLVINSYLKQMNDVGVEFCFMEVSSHGIHQHRTKGLHFTGGIFTNLSHDHLDYHSSFAEYRDVKKSFFDGLPKTAFALTNVDDKNGKIMTQNTIAKTYSYALKSYADYRTQILENHFKGLLLKINDSELWVKLIGSFNAYNLTAVFACADILGLEKDELLRLMSTLENVNGRFEYFITANNITVIVDYAHTPDALKNVLQTINDIRTQNEDLISVVGCGGDRDKTKRPKMGHIASALSSKVIFTSDNPRSEDPDAIISEIEKGVEPQNFKKIMAITNRKQAIKTACQLANANDIILVAGKGHESYQEINGVRTEFNDYKVALECLNQLQK